MRKIVSVFVVMMLLVGSVFALPKPDVVDTTTYEECVYMSFEGGKYEIYYAKPGFGNSGSNDEMIQDATTIMMAEGYVPAMMNTMKVTAHEDGTTTGLLEYWDYVTLLCKIHGQAVLRENGLVSIRGTPFVSWSIYSKLPNGYLLYTSVAYKPCR